MTRRQMLDGIGELNELAAAEVGDPEINTRIAQYEMAFRMQTSVPELTDLSDEPEQHVRPVRSGRAIPGTYAANCLLARRLVERGVRFMQLFHRGWDQHGNLPSGIPALRRTIDQPALGASCRTSSSAGCSTTRWSSGAANSVAPSIEQVAATTTAAITIRAVSASGWPVAA